MNDPRWTAGRAVSVVLADQQHIFLEGLRQVLQRSSLQRFDVKALVSRPESLLDALTRQPAELIILDPAMARGMGTALVAKIKRRYPGTRLLVVSAEQGRQDAQRYLTAGADAYLPKSGPVEDLYLALSRVLEGGTYLSRELSEEDQAEDGLPRDQRLTRREVEVLRLISQGLSNKDIGRQLYISDQTVSVHRKNIMRKMSVKNTAALVRLAFERQLI